MESLIQTGEGLQRAEAIIKVQWQDIRSLLLTVNPKLTHLIDNLPLSASLPLWVLRCAYGTALAQYGKLSWHNFNLSSTKIAEEFSYANFPLMLSLNKASEIFMEKDSCAMAFNLLPPGEILGADNFCANLLGESILMPWNINAGARSIFLLPKVTDSHAHKRLWREFRVAAHPPVSMWDQHANFVQIAKVNAKNANWESHLLLFPNVWFKKIEQDSAWLPLRNYLLQKSIEQNAYLRQQSILHFLWSVLEPNIDTQYLKPRPYLVNTVNHLLSLGMGLAPGYRPATDCNQAAPIALFEEAYVDIYGLKEYLPIIMYPQYLRDCMQPSYYSLACPPLLNGLPTLKTTPNTIAEVRDVRYLIEIMRRELLAGSQFQDQHLLATRYDYFHTHVDVRDDIRLTDQLAVEDKNLMKTCRPYVGRTFPVASPFIRGCVRIARQLASN